MLEIPTSNCVPVAKRIFCPTPTKSLWVARNGIAAATSVHDENINLFNKMMMSYMSEEEKGRERGMS